MKKALSLVLCFVLVAVMALPALAAGYTVDSESGNASYENAYGYVFKLDLVNDTNVAEKNVLFTSQPAMGDWWTFVALEKVEGDTYKAVIDAALWKYRPEGFTLGENQIILVCHSSSSKPTEAETYPNWENKIALAAVKTGDFFTFSGVDFENATLAEGATATCTAEKPATPGGETGPAITETAILSTGKSYTTTAPNRGEGNAFNDDGVKLTNGVKGLEDAGTVETAGWNNLDKTTANVVEIVVDLGESVLSNSYVIYIAGGNWGIGLPTEDTSVEVFASDSADGEFTSVASAAKEDLVLKTGDGTSTNKWSTYTLTANAAAPVQARYIKFVVTAEPVGNGFIWMDEVEVLAVKTASGSEPEVIVETITVDGDLTDTGWAADKWISVNADNGYWQAIPESETISYKYQLRADDTKLYAAFVVDCAAVEGGNGAGTNVRFWINTDSEATVYTHFYDVYLKDGAVAVNAKYNTAKDSNSGANIESSTINAVMTTADGKTYVEFSVDLAEFNGAEGFNYFVCVSNKVNENVCLYYPVVAEDGESRTANLPYAKWYAEGQATVDVEAIQLGEVVVDGGTNDNLGDAGIYAIAALALVALIGTAVVIKKRA